MNNSLSIKSLAEKLESKHQSRSKHSTQSTAVRAHNTGYWLAKIKLTMFKSLNKLQYGSLVIKDAEKKYHFKAHEMKKLNADIEVLDVEFYKYLAFGGSVGAGEAYINGYWRTNNLTKVIQFFALNQSVTDNVEGGIARLAEPVKKILHWLNKNTQKGSKKNIVAHYDLGNQFFQKFLDPTMMYSAGVFHKNTDSMEQASYQKLERICQRLRLTENDNVIEIGTGWGGFAIYAAENYSCKVTTTTISEEQYAMAKARIKKAGLENRITLLKQDYRSLQGKYDKLVSIEMIEAVGHHYFNTFFEKCSHLLKPHGEMLLQAITISDQRFERAKNEIDFIKKYIFPGSCIPSIDSISDSVRQASDMRILNSEDIGMHYALTLEKWREQFFKNIHAIKEQGYSDAFIRMWEFYLCYCEGGFRERVISDIQMHLVKPIARVPMDIQPLTHSKNSISAHKRK